MITLFTGVPGSGKTAALVDLLRTIAADRPLYVMGLNGLKLPHTETNVRNWSNDVPDGSIVVVDEVQQIWRPAGPGQKVPEDIAALETHRHRGIDFYVTTQNPKLVHSNVRDLVGRHIHIRDVGLLGRWWYEWPECSTSIAWRSAPIKKRYKLPKAAFALYKSASMHVKPVRSFPRVVALLGVTVALAGFLSWKAYNAIHARLAPEPVVVAPTGVATPGAGRVGIPQQAGALSGTQNGPISARSIVASFTPRIAERPETAPAYDHLRLVATMPRIAGGWCQGESCRCILQTGQRAPITDAACRAWLADPPFDPYARSGQPAQNPQPYGAAAQPAQALPPVTAPASAPSSA